MDQINQLMEHIKWCNDQVDDFDAHLDLMQRKMRENVEKAITSKAAQQPLDADAAAGVEKLETIALKMVAEMDGVTNPVAYTKEIVRRKNTMLELCEILVSKVRDY